ncbi:MAG: AraC family transcriptional regulator, partial [Victivallaceae bacterium]|nr:AraC family transcriptional regulator [Victivallaceae bacterium]
LLGLSYRLLSRIALEHAEPESPDDRLLSSARLMLEKDFQHPLPVPEVARSLGISRSRLDRLFREKLQQSPLEYRIRKKMERAAYLLGTALSVKEVAFLLGYCNQFHFSNEFKRFHGVSPQIHQQGSD